jgi:hypothetical protein
VEPVGRFRSLATLTTADDAAASDGGSDMSESVGLLPWAAGGILIVAGVSRIWPGHRTAYAVVIVVLLLGAAVVGGPRLWVRLTLAGLAVGVTVLALRRQRPTAG